MKKLFATLLTLTLLVGTMATTAFAAETVQDGCLSITNVIDTQSGIISNSDALLYACDDYATITITEDIRWVDISYYDGMQFQLIAMSTTYGGGLPVFDYSNVTVVATGTNTTYTMEAYLDGVDADEIDFYADAYITAGSSFDILYGSNYYLFETVTLDGEVFDCCVYPNYDVATVVEAEEVTEEVAEEAEVVVEEVIDDGSFSDVAEEDVFYDAVMWAVEAGVTTGYADGTFRPDATCTRGQVVTFLYRAAGEPEITTTENPFSDVSESSPYYTAILWAVENGITTGYEDGTFRPNDTCTSAQVVTFLYRAEGEPEATDFESELAAAAAAAYAPAITWADAISLLEGMDFVGSSDSPRSDIVTYLYLVDGTHEMA